MKRNLYTWLNVHNNEGAGTGAGGDGQGGTGGEGGGNITPPPTPNPGDLEKKFTQADVNRFVAEQHKKTIERANQLEKQLNEVLATKNLTEKEKDDIKARLEEIQNATMSKEEQYKKEIDKTTKTYSKQVESLTGERDTWRKKYDTLCTDLEI